MWERACSRKRWISQRMCNLTHRFREQARSHILNEYTHHEPFFSTVTALRGSGQFRSLAGTPQRPARRHCTDR
ncbi:hypothetical protein C1X89_33645 [Pseudomonas sp. GP01-A8]|nr:hypothetical protein C1X90_33590 [Pseudomonas sp. GP01-A9]PMU16426.1 hypothetical protein C1X88_33115 [Pseudomonas sp. GP01-A13]PMU30519.1 hypothetical protein C1X89_33645 [Pseudomonas sp. GP01-A8]PMU46782.1 hypothetical protein C1X85_33605 [Pseudomonas sp. GP01-A6]PMU58590.1 hypothetical protein C1X86_33020 [Pseudomonas sp. GP01-A3]PMU65533.1 hypothetical protein C1X81_32790 [Pseudomonas sp. FW215-L2]PMU65919.1 hypothetical protein C1X84_33335 [Pseudomonas sp. GP01-A1]PMU68229.1 hypothet